MNTFSALITNNGWIMMLENKPPKKLFNIRSFHKILLSWLHTTHAKPQGASKRSKSEIVYYLLSMKF